MAPEGSSLYRQIGAPGRATGRHGCEGRRPTISQLTGVLRYAEVVVFAAIGLACLRLWRRERGPAAAWLTVTFGDLATVSLIGLALPQHLVHSLGPADPEHWFIKALALAVLVAPYPLFRFTDAMEQATPRRHVVAGVLAAAVAIWTLALPRIQASSDHRRPWWALALLGLVAIEWVSLSSMVGIQLWKAGRGQPTAVRRQMQLLAAGAIFLILALVPSLASSNNDPNSPAHLAAEIIGLTTAVLFYLGFSPPAALRGVWRRREEAALVRAEMTLMSVVSADEIAKSILPPVGAMFGARRCAMVGLDGEVLGLHGISASEAALWQSALPSLSRVSGPARLSDGIVALPLRHGWLVIETGVYTPLFGQEELGLLYTLGAFIDLALERAELFARERDTREALERTHAELESLVYSFSHDLKSPLISLLGYLDYLRSDYGDRLDDTGRHYLDRMSISAVYMTELIQDLLELSRIGRTETEMDDVALEPLIRDIAESVRSTHPGVSVDVGRLPVLHGSPLRVRQLFTNLVENAAKHGGRSDLRIAVSARRPDSDADHILIIVRDNGKGIPSEYRERVFGIFERLEAREGASGTGMGLAICRKIVEQMGGHISIADSGPGTALHIELPTTLLRSSDRRIPLEV